MFLLTKNTNIGVRRLFQGRGKKFPGGPGGPRGGGGQQQTICLKAPNKILIYSKKVENHTILRPAGGQWPPLDLPYEHKL